MEKFDRKDEIQNGELRADFSHRDPQSHLEKYSFMYIRQFDFQPTNLEFGPPSAPHKIRDMWVGGRAVEYTCMSIFLNVIVDLCAKNQLPSRRSDLCIFYRTFKNSSQCDSLINPSCLEPLL